MISARFPGSMLMVALLISACGPVKEKKRVVTPDAYAKAQTASRLELVQLINSRYAGVATLTAPKFEVELTGGSIDDGYFEKYRKAGGYLVAQKPDSIFVNILNPLTHSSVLTMASLQNAFEIWIPSRNQYLTGQTVGTEKQENPLYNVRPEHILQGILFEPFPADGDRGYKYYVEETEDGQFKYYVLVLVQAGLGDSELKLVRKVWIERSEMSVVRQQYFENQKVQSSIMYNHPVQFGGEWINTVVEINRPLDRYRIDFVLDPDKIVLNRPIQANAFQIAPPPGAEVIRIDQEDETKSEP